MKTLLIVLLLLSQDSAVQRNPEPDAEAQKATLKQLKDLFKTEYSKKSAADQVDLARKLITTSADTGVDINTKYVCLTEARDLGVAAADTAVAMDAVTLLGKSFTIAVPAAKMAVLGKLATVARETEKVRALAKGYYELAKDGIVGEDYETAASAATKADTLARAAKDALLADRAAELKKDIATLKTEYGRVKAAIDNPAGGDLDAVGRYMCFVRNEWPTGLKILSDGGKSPLKELAGKDLANPPGVDAQAEVGDGWWTQAQAEKISWKKQNILSRARHWYEQALPASTGLVKVRLMKRMAELENVSPGGGINLLALIDPKKDAVHGEWSMEDGILVNKGNESLVLQIPFEPPDEYDLRVGARRMGSTDSMMIGLVAGSTQVTYLADAYPGNGGWLTGFEQIDGKFLTGQPNAMKGKQLIGTDKPTVFEIAVRKGSITVNVDGKKLLSYEGQMGKLGNRPDSGTPDQKALYVGGWGSRMGFTEIRITPLSGPGKKTK